MRLALVALLAGVFSFCAIGCGESVGNVSGEVKLKDKPLQEGLITFSSQAPSKRVVFSNIKDGKYTLNNVPAGQAIITVQPAGQKGKPAAPVPAKYFDPKKSPLNYTVTTGNQNHDVVLELDDAKK